MNSKHTAYKKEQTTTQKFSPLGPGAIIIVAYSTLMMKTMKMMKNVAIGLESKEKEAFEELK